MPAPIKATRPTASSPAPTPARPVKRVIPTSTTSIPTGAPSIKLSVPTEASGSDIAPGVMELKGLADFTPPASIANFLDEHKISTVNVCFGKWAEGPISVATQSKGKYRVRRQPITLSHPMFTRLSEVAPGLTPRLVLNVESNKITGQVGLAVGTKVEDLSKRIAQAPALLGLVGFTITSLPSIINTIEGGSLHLGLKGMPIQLGSAFSGTFNFEVINDAITFDGNATVNVKGLANGTLDLKRAADGAITGKATVGLTLPKNFSGGIDVAWDGTAITGMGKVGYKGEKFSGEVTLYLMEKKQAEQLSESKKAPEGAAPKQETSAKSADKKPAKIDYVVFGEGDLAFSFTDWLTGTAHVIADPKGNITVIGKITPQNEFILFEQKDYIKQLFKLEARASYGLPVVGNVFIFANVSMDLFAKLGPAKFYKIVIEGTYSTDPKVAKNFSIRGSLNISAAAGARLRGEAGVGLEILAHDIKAGAGVNGIAGIKAYAEATPIVGYREKAAEGQDKKGEWFIRGELEVGAQPFLGLSGDLFVEVDAPWWSPVPDKKWTWPLGGKEWPLGTTMGMLVSVDYVFGSGQWPKFDFKPVEFDSSKFMTNLYEDKAKSGSGKEVEKKGKWAEKNSKSADPPAKTSPKGNATPGKAGAKPTAKPKPVSSKKSGKPADPNAKTKEGKTVKQLQDEATKKGKKPEGVDAKGGKGEAAKKDKDKDMKDQQLKDALAALEAVTKRYAKDGATKDEVEDGVNAVRRKFKKVFKSLKVIDGKGKTWDYDYETSPGTHTNGPKQATKKLDPDTTESESVLKSLAIDQPDKWKDDSVKTFRNKGAGHVWIRPKDKPNFGVSEKQHSGKGGGDKLLSKVKKELKEHKLLSAFSLPERGLKGINYHTETMVANIAKGIISSNPDKVQRVDFRYYSFFEVCDECKSNIKTTQTPTHGDAPPKWTRGAERGIQFNSQYPPHEGSKTILRRDDPNYEPALRLSNSASKEKGWFTTFDVE